MNTDLSYAGVSEEAARWAHNEGVVLRKQIGGQIAYGMIIATLLYIPLFYGLLGDFYAGHISSIALVLHLIGLRLHRAELSWAPMWSLIVGLTQLTTLDTLVLHSEVGSYLWMMTLPPFAIMACARAWERRSITLLTISAMLLCALVRARFVGESVNAGLIISLISIIGSSLLLSYITRWSLRQIERSQALLAEEHARSEALLLNVLPQEIVGRLKGNKQHLHDVTIADTYEHASVLFADIVGFTELSSKLPPQELVNMLNHYFTAFDYLSAHYEIEKIKTIGDAYMAATGILREDEGALERLADLALAMLKEVERLNQAQGLALQLRIGVHFGPVTAGVIGKQKFIYDLWGDTVNTAARLESHGVPGKVQVSEVVKQKLSARFLFEEGGVKSLKGKGEMKTYFLTSSSQPAP